MNLSAGILKVSNSSRASAGEQIRNSQESKLLTKLPDSGWFAFQVGAAWNFEPLESNFEFVAKLRLSNRKVEILKLENDLKTLDWFQCASTGTLLESSLINFDLNCAFSSFFQML